MTITCLSGIITNRDLRFETDLPKKIKDAMTSENLITAPVRTTLSEAQKNSFKHKIEKLPIVDEKSLKGLITIKDMKKLSVIRYRDKNGRLLVGAAIGVTNVHWKELRLYHMMQVFGVVA